MQTILTLQVDNFLSFRKSEVTLAPLNILVGPNGAGKTNFLKIFQFLGDVARLDLIPAIDSFGGISELRFRGTGGTRDIRIKLTGQMTEHASERAPDEYELSFYDRSLRLPARAPTGAPSGVDSRRLVGRAETIIVKRTAGRGRRIRLTGRTAEFAPLRTNQESLRVSVQEASAGLNTLRKLGNEYDAPQVEALAQVFENLRLFEVNVESIRQPSRVTSPSRLAPDGSNVAHFLLWLSMNHQAAFERLCDDMRYVLPGFEAFKFVPIGGSGEAMRLDLKERHLDGPTSLARASFGTIRAIAIFAMLHDPNPPRLTCLEEIDHGFHPHALDRVVERLREASVRTQIIVATHSPALVNRVHPRELIIFERDPDNGATRIVVIDPDQAQKMEEESGYRLGELWFSGIIGGGLGQEDQ